ncbi:MAG TPA: DUF4097 family beta strand repeat-containing protein [Acidimicrobiia bacterium]
MGLLRVTTRSGNITVIGEDRDDVVVDRGPEPEVGPDGAVTVTGRSGATVVRCPAGTDVRVGTGSGDVVLRGRLGDARATTGSGKIEAEHVERLDARTKSGSLTVEYCGGDCQLHTGSGSVRVGRAGDVDVGVGSGSVEAGEVTGGKVRASSGSVDVGLSGGGELEVRAHSGSVRVTVPEGMRPRTSLKSGSGAVRCDCETGKDGKVEVKTESGSIVVAPR